MMFKRDKAVSFTFYGLMALYLCNFVFACWWRSTCAQWLEAKRLSEELGREDEPMEMLDLPKPVAWATKVHGGGRSAQSQVITNSQTQVSPSGV